MAFVNGNKVGTRTQDLQDQGVGENYGARAASKNRSIVSKQPKSKAVKADRYVEKAQRDNPWRLKSKAVAPAKKFGKAFKHVGLTAVEHGANRVPKKPPSRKACVGFLDKLLANDAYASRKSIMQNVKKKVTQS